MSVAASMWCLTHPGGPWLACFGQSLGFTSEGPLSTLDVPGVQDTCLAPTQEFRTCTTKGRKIQEKSSASCDTTLQQRKNYFKCSESHLWACSVARARCAADPHICRLTGRQNRTGRKETKSLGQAFDVRALAGLAARKLFAEGPKGERVAHRVEASVPLADTSAEAPAARVESGPGWSWGAA